MQGIKDITDMLVRPHLLVWPSTSLIKLLHPYNMFSSYKLAPIATLLFCSTAFALSIGPVANLHIVNGAVTPDGFTREAVLADGTFPGPLIKGEKVMCVDLVQRPLLMSLSYRETILSSMLLTISPMKPCGRARPL